VCVMGLESLVCAWGDVVCVCVWFILFYDSMAYLGIGFMVCYSFFPMDGRGRICCRLCPVFCF
jgi:hypothetical protein